MKMDIFKMSKIEKLKKVLKKTCRSHFVTIMLSFSKNDEKKCDDNFFKIFCKLLKNNFLGDIMETLGDKNPAFSGHKFSCSLCDFHTSKKSHYNEHLSTLKHKNQLVGDVQLTNPASFRPPGKFCCSNCSRPYQSRNGLWKHQKKCFEDSGGENSADIKQSLLSDKELMMMLVKQNTQLMEVLKNGTHNNTHSNNTNNNHSHNKTFNLQFFLNETCKDAMNIGDFVSSIKPQLEDLEATGRLGYVEGISNIILNNLKTLQIHDRPIHCSDQKREVIYIKDNDEWTKEDDDKPILTKAIKVIANENIKNIKEWRNEYPDCTSADSKKNNLYLKIVSNSMSGISAAESNKNINKIISNVAKQVVIDKTGRDTLHNP
jgi:hypothetical protein